MASMRDIKRRRSSVSSIQQITKAMKLVSTVKLQHAKTAVEHSKAYFRYMIQTLQEIIQKSPNITHRYLSKSTEGKIAVLLITSNRGLAGGYNSNVVKLISRHPTWKQEDLVLYCAGHKGRDALARRGYTIVSDESKLLDEPTYDNARKLSTKLLEDFEKGEICEIHVAYTNFQNTVSHVPTLLPLLPVTIEEVQDETDDHILMNFEPQEEEALNAIIPTYVSTLIYGAFLEAAASENGARMQAMDSATGNAQEMIEDLALLYNRARQGSITQELTEIIAGAEAIS
ncbi:MAG: ATP synthase F1 subunit gamma [Clostridium sp.]|jgi:F-type H+-transporting ATPase subunit gamma|nr:ATP synthase F1 subunit gamma [Clostridium sp.]